MISVSVVIPTFRHQTSLRDLLGSLERQTCDINFEVIVIANLPEVGLKKVVESYGPKFRFHETGRLGVNIARNKGFDLARGALILFLDDDVYLNDRDFVQKHFNEHARHPQAIAIGGPYTPKAAMTPVETAYHLILEHRFSSIRLERSEARTLVSGNVSLKRDQLETRHRFDDRVKFGASEESFFAKLRGEQNLFLIFDSLSVEHRARVTLLALTRKGFYQGYGRKFVACDSSTMLERPHWNSNRSLEETFRAAHASTTVLFKLAVTLYKKAYAYGEKLAVRDSVPMIATTAIKATIRPRPEFSLAKAVGLLVSGHRGRRPMTVIRHRLTMLQAALTSAELAKDSRLDLPSLKASMPAGPEVQTR